MPVLEKQGKVKMKSVGEKVKKKWGKGMKGGAENRREKPGGREWNRVNRIS